jgi:ABC-type multidrug transport system ATPase subunit/peptidoglycan/LPS O-acetylase OafA/YrhL
MATEHRLHALDAVRAGALLLGVAFHAAFSFLPGMPPGVWAIVDRSPSTALSVVMFASHIFRMSLFFFVAGFFARMLHQRGGSRGFWVNRSKRILLPLVAGWVVVFPLIAGVWVWGLTKTFGGTLPPAPANLPPPPPGAFPLTHLWFLYYLLVLYACVLLGRRLVVALDRQGSIRAAIDRGVRALAARGATALALALPVTLALYFPHDNWIAWFGIPTPDQSLIPAPVSLISFGTAVVFGWLVHRQPDLLEIWGRQWPLHAAVAIASTIACLSVVGATPHLVPAARGLQTFGYAFCYSLAIWCWSLGLVGVAVRFLSQEQRHVRYVADASYWIYILHLPVVAAFQVLVGHLTWHWSIKLAFIMAASLAILFTSYRYLVRSTFIGQVLNGRRYPRGPLPGNSGGPLRSAHDIEDKGGAPPAGVPPRSGVGRPTLAILEGVHKRYGKTTALAGLDLEVRAGELLAVLGPNGAGKSTAISLWLGLLEPDAGSVRLFGRPPQDVESRRQVGVMMQEVGLTPELRVHELVTLTASYYPDPLSTPDVLNLAHIEPLANRSYAKLSAGQKRQVQFALAVCGRPSLLFLDEPTVGLDVEARATMWRTVKALVARGCSIVLTTHYLEEAEALADRVAVLAGGRLLASGSVDEIRSLVSRKQISCRTSLAAATVQSWPDVVSVRADDHRLYLTVVDSESALRRLLAADEGIRDIEVRQAGLAEAFVELTREAA